MPICELISPLSLLTPANHLALHFRTRRTKPRPTQIPNAFHSDGEKCPGNAGRTFIKKSSNETAIPSPVTMSIETSFYMSQKDRQAATDPRTESTEQTQ